MEKIQQYITTKQWNEFNTEEKREIFIWMYDEKKYDTVVNEHHAKPEVYLTIGQMIDYIGDDWHWKIGLSEDKIDNSNLKDKLFEAVKLKVKEKCNNEESRQEITIDDLNLPCSHNEIEGEFTVFEIRENRRIVIMRDNGTYFEVDQKDVNIH